jgi:hypothetical protein
MAFKEVQPFKSAYGKSITDLTNKVVNRQAFTYDPNTDAAYQAAAKKYERLGDRAMQNTLADYASQTGGMASSYAVSAASQAQNDYNQQLADLIPSLMDVAYNRYKSEYDMNNSALSQLQSLENAAYGRWSDNRAYNRDKFVSDRTYNRGVYESNRDYNYRSSRDKVLDSQWSQEFGLENKKFAWQKSQGNSGGGGGSRGRGGSRRGYSGGGGSGGGSEVTIPTGPTPNPAAKGGNSLYAKAAQAAKKGILNPKDVKKKIKSMPWK